MNATMEKVIGIQQIGENKCLHISQVVLYSCHVFTKEREMDHSQFYMTAQDYENDRLSNRISVLEKEIRALKGIPEPEPPPPMTMQEILQVGCEQVFGKMYGEKNEK